MPVIQVISSTVRQPRQRLPFHSDYQSSFFFEVQLKYCLNLILSLQESHQALKNPCPFEAPPKALIITCQLLAMLFVSNILTHRPSPEWSQWTSRLGTTCMHLFISEICVDWGQNKCLLMILIYKGPQHL